MRTVTFYSYKGGSGRSLLLANAARFLALSGRRVVAVDFDFEAPGLHYKLNIGRPGQRAADVVPKRGVVDYMLAANAGNEPQRLDDYVLPVALPSGSGALWLMPAGAAPSGDYWRSLTELAKRGMLSDPDSLLIADFLELKFRLEEDLKADFLLIDARTGITELTGIATTLLADMVVCLMLDNPESLAGTRAVLRSLGRAVRLEGQDPVEVLAVLSRVPERDATREERVMAYLNEPGPTPADTLVADQLLVLPNDPEIAQQERVLLEGLPIGAPGASTLAQGYLGLMNALAPEVIRGVRTALQRQEAVQAMRAWLTARAPQRSSGLTKPYAFAEAYPESQVAEAVLVTSDEPMADGSQGSLYADLAVFGDDRSTPHLAAVFAADLPGSNEWRSWQDSAVDRLLLFNLDAGGRLNRRAFGRSRDTHELIEHGSGR